MDLRAQSSLATLATRHCSITNQHREEGQITGAEYDLQARRGAAAPETPSTSRSTTLAAARKRVFMLRAPQRLSYLAGLIDGGRRFVYRRDALADDLALELRKGQQNIERQTPHRRRRVELLRH